MPSPCRRPLMSRPRCWALSFQSSTQEIGEELINGVIYSISLRKVQLHQGATKGQRWLGVSMERRPGARPHLPLPKAQPTHKGPADLPPYN